MAGILGNRLVGQIMNACVNNEIRLVVSAFIWIEYGEITSKRSVRRTAVTRRIPLLSIEHEIIRLQMAAEMVYPTGEPPPCRDEKDRPFLHCAVAADADYLVTRDRDLLDLATVGSTRIVTPEQFLAAFADA